MSPSCPFCEIGRSNPAGSPTTHTVFYSTDKVLAFLDIQPLVASSAHVLIIPRKHYATLDELSSDLETSGALGIALAQVSKVLKTEFSAEAFNVVQNNGHAAGQVVHHVHFHLVMRKQSSNAESRLPHGAVVMEKLFSSQAFDTIDFKTKMSYSSLIFGRGLREDLDDDWADIIVPKLRSLLPSNKLKL